ncbi:MBL fold metallo-hydrolase [Rhodobacteraceae bacterium]|nr:MBL fold metallo-hydrolase [Paracoccaceae bacterium]|tara:strand:+ start:1542 stop:2438 length:897 start_codon:yes stop_codon:yes gene_type:complete
MMQTTIFITLGTAGGPVPNLYRAQPAHAVVTQDRTLLIDCGEGAMGQLMRAGIDFRNVHDIFISHHHFDHIGSLFACLGMNMMLQRKTPLNIYGPPGTRQMIDALCSACDVPWGVGFGIRDQKLPHPIEFIQTHDISPDDKIKIDELDISFCENTHFRGDENFGHDGPISLSLRFDAPDRSIVFTGDTGPCRNLEKFAKGAQLLVGELMDAEGTMRRVRQKNPHMSDVRIEMMGDHMARHHLSPEQLGELATRAGVEHVVAVHIPLESIHAKTAPEYIAKIASRFLGKITLAEDLDRF